MTGRPAKKQRKPMSAEAKARCIAALAKARIARSAKAAERRLLREAEQRERQAAKAQVQAAKEARQRAMNAMASATFALRDERKGLIGSGDAMTRSRRQEDRQTKARRKAKAAGLDPEARDQGVTQVNVATFERIDDPDAPLRQRFETVVSTYQARVASSIDWLAARYPHRVTQAMRDTGMMFSLFVDRARSFGPRGMDIGKLRVDGGSGRAPEPLLGYIQAMAEGAELVRLLGARGVLFLAAVCGDGKGVEAVARDYAAEAGIPVRNAQAYVTERVIEALQLLTQRWQVPEPEVRRNVIRAAMDGEAVAAVLAAAGDMGRAGKRAAKRAGKAAPLERPDFDGMSEADKEAWVKRFGRGPKT